MAGSEFNRFARKLLDGARGLGAPQHGRAKGFRKLRLEPLETRNLLSVNLPGIAIPDYLSLAAEGVPAPLSTAGPTGYTPAQIRQAYGFNKITFDGGTVTGNGAGTTIAIVDAYDDPNIANDLHQFDLAFGLPDPVFTKVNETGGSALPAANRSWATEIALDVEWAHAVAPGANILLVEANSASFTDLLTAVSYAAGVKGVVDVSMSWGGGDFSGETQYDSYFITPSGHSGVTFVAASGDSGAPVGYPAVSPNVLAVGGTTLTLNGQGTWTAESGWSGSGGGISADETQPSYQKGVVTQSTTFRSNPDVSYDADPATGFPVYDSYNNSLADPWGQWGGTSDAAPQWAALIAIADQGRALAGKPALSGSQTLSMIYSLSNSDFHDITTGSSTGSPPYSAGRGYDLVTGRGSPIANLVVGDLVGSSSAPSAPTVAPPTISSIVVGEATPQNGILESNEQGIITWAAASPNTIASVSLTVDGKAVTPIYGPYGPYSTGYYYGGVFGPLTAGTHSYVIQVTDNTGLTSTATSTFTVAAAGPVISSIVVAEAKPQFGVLESNEQGVISWALADSKTITATSLRVDGVAVSPIYGPYGPYGNSYYYSGVFAPLAAGGHTFTVQATDSSGADEQLQRKF